MVIKAFLWDRLVLGMESWVASSPHNYQNESAHKKNCPISNCINDVYVFPTNRCSRRYWWFRSSNCEITTETKKTTMIWLRTECWMTHTNKFMPRVFHSWHILVWRHNEIFRFDYLSPKCLSSKCCENCFWRGWRRWFWLLITLKMGKPKEVIGCHKKIYISDKARHKSSYTVYGESGCAVTVFALEDSFLIGVLGSSGLTVTDGAESGRPAAPDSWWHKR